MTITYRVRNGIYVNLTNRCPCACTFCLRRNGPGVYGSDPLWLAREPTVAEVEASLDGWDLASFDEVVFCGYGEPTERLDVLLETAGHIREVAPSRRIRVNTNGLSDLFYGRDTAPDFNGLLDTVSISLNASNAARYLELTRSRFGMRSFEAMLAFAERAKAYVPDVVLTVVDHVEDDGEIAKCRALCEARGLRLRVRAYEAS